MTEEIGALAILIAIAVACSLIAGVLLGWMLGASATKARYHAALRRCWRRRWRLIEDEAAGGDADAQMFLHVLPHAGVIDAASRRELEQAVIEERRATWSDPWRAGR
jgi:hypothetical protein